MRNYRLFPFFREMPNYKTVKKVTKTKMAKTQNFSLLLFSESHIHSIFSVSKSQPDCAKHRQHAASALQRMKGLLKQSACGMRV